MTASGRGVNFGARKPILSRRIGFRRACHTAPTTAQEPATRWFLLCVLALAAWAAREGHGAYWKLERLLRPQVLRCVSCARGREIFRRVKKAWQGSCYTASMAETQKPSQHRPRRRGRCQNAHAPVQRRCGTAAPAADALANERRTLTMSKRVSSSRLCPQPRNGAPHSSLSVVPLEGIAVDGFFPLRERRVFRG